jgi:NAD(P)-dependent dehydrogenase (short-subunit alcohol dehydrogenase family)
VGQIERMWRYDGRRVVVTGCASGIGAEVARQVAGLGAEVIGLDVRPPAAEVAQFHEVDLADPASVDRVAGSLGDRVDALFNVAGVSSGIGDPLKVVTVNFLGSRRLTEAVVPLMPPGSAVANVSSLAASGYRERRRAVAGLLRTTTVAEGIAWCDRNPGELADGGYTLSKSAIIYYTMSKVVDFGARGIRINCTGPGVTETPILDYTRKAYGQDYLDNIPKPLGRVADAAEQAAVLVFLNSDAASYVSGQLLWVDGGQVSSETVLELEEETG